MEIAGEPAGLADLGKADTIAPVRTGIEEGMNFAVFAAGHNDRVLTYRAGQKIPDFGQLGIMGNEDPASGENSFQFQCIDIVLPENPAI
ncbi:hypothetical protein GCM10011393_34170 [Sphingopyxis bauzanensis]|nr:hypothetical protein GCM10011393_34170 [Sphingopyxis bauzanensis]